MRAQDIGVAVSIVKLGISTIHQVWEIRDTIVAQAANPIFGKLQFYVIISSAIDSKLKSHPQMIGKTSLRLLTTVQKW